MRSDLIPVLALFLSFPLCLPHSNCRSMFIKTVIFKDPDIRCPRMCGRRADTQTWQKHWGFCSLLFEHLLNLLDWDGHRWNINAGPTLNRGTFAEGVVTWAESAPHRTFIGLFHLLTERKQTLLESDGVNYLMSTRHVTDAGFGFWTSDARLKCW